ncbi:MAG TPA: HEAT repeat domain-containing protein [Gemmatimonadales bacterium]|nr:HEAT repeat domain-containing protein [Gemmatimonadales bacterium]
MSDAKTFVTSFGRLIAAYRAGPAGAGEAASLLAQVEALVARDPMSVEAGIVRSGEYDTANLRSHLLRRQVETLSVAAGTPADVLEALARALGGEAALPEHPSLGYEMVAEVVPRAPSPVRVASPEAPPLVLMGTHDFPEEDDRAPSAFGAEVSALTTALASAGARGAWTEVLHAAQALVRLSSRVPELDRRTVAITARRALSPALLRGMIEYAIRTPEEQARAAEVLQWRGGEAAELMIESIRKTESPVPHRFLLDALSRMPAAVPLLIPLLGSPAWHEARHAADALGRQMAPEALGPLRVLLAHPEARVRGAALEALSRYPASAGLESLRAGLAHPVAETRRDAALAIGQRGGGALAMPLLAALEGERDPATWRAMLTALSRIEAPEAASALVTLALRRRGLLSRSGLTVAQRLEVVAALARSPTRAAAQALGRVAREAEGVVGAAARGELDRALATSE